MASLHNNILKSFTRPKAESYVVPKAEEIVIDKLPDTMKAPTSAQNKADAFTAAVIAAAEEEQKKKEAAPPPPPPPTPVDYAKLQADAILQDAERQAEEIRERARSEMAEECERQYALAREDGRRLGYNEGMSSAYEQAQQEYAVRADALMKDVQKFLDRVAAAEDARCDEAMEGMKELALTVAEKVIKVSLQSSREVIAQMIRSAVDKRKRREWVHIYLCETDAKGITQLPPSLAQSLADLSDRVKIIPMSDDEPGTCIIETPDEIIDASAATQLSNIRGILAEPTS